MRWSALFSSFLVLHSLAAAPAVARTAAPLVAQVGEQDAQFRQRFQDAMKLDATEEMAKLVRAMNEPAVNWILETAEAIGNQPTDALVLRMNALQAAWKSSMNTAFAEKMNEYFSLLEHDAKVERGKLRNAYTATHAEFGANLQKKDGPAFASLSARFQSLAEGFDRVGDKYNASQCWILQGTCNREDMRGSDADPRAVCKAYKRALEAREEIGLNDKLWVETKQKYDSLEAEGFDSDAPAAGEPGAGAPAVKPAAGAAMITAAMGFERVDDLSAYERPMYYADEIYQTWNAFYMKGKGSSFGISTMAEDISPKAHRVGANEIRIDADGDGQAEQVVRVTGNLESVEFEIGKGAEKRRWACLTTVGTDKEMFQQVQINQAPNDQDFPLYFVPAASMVGEIGGVPVRVFDDNADGIYGSLPLAPIAHHGLLEGHAQPELDSVAIGSSKRALPWSKYQKVGEQWYELASAAGGNQLQATPVELQTGTLKLKAQGVKPAWLIVRGKGPLEQAYFDLAAGKAEVPAGSYELFYGELRQGKKRQVAKAVILPGPSTIAWTVAAGETATVEIGAPYRFEFGYERNGDKLSVKGKSVVVAGVAGERYERLWNCTPRPEVSWRATGEKRGSKPEKMDLVLDQQKYGRDFWTMVWFPLDLELELKGAPEAIEVQLVEEKSKLFGQIESAWKGH